MGCESRKKIRAAPSYGGKQAQQNSHVVSFSSPGGQQVAGVNFCEMFYFNDQACV
jgi:hypothetical protein